MQKLKNTQTSDQSCYQHVGWQYRNRCRLNVRFDSSCVESDRTSLFLPLSFPHEVMTHCLLTPSLMSYQTSAMPRFQSQHEHIFGTPLAPRPDSPMCSWLMKSKIDANKHKICFWTREKPQNIRPTLSRKVHTTWTSAAAIFKLYQGLQTANKFHVHTSRPKIWFYSSWHSGWKKLLFNLLFISTVEVFFSFFFLKQQLQHICLHCHNYNYSMCQAVSS